MTHSYLLNKTKNGFRKPAILALLLTCGISSLKAQYCTPTYGNGTGAGDYISNVEIVGTTLNSNSGGAPAPYYTVFPTAGSTTGTMDMETPYQINVTGGTYGTCYISAWGDWNRNGVFEASEFIGSSPNAGALTNVNFGNIIIPGSTGPGIVRIRFRSSDTAAPGAAESCGTTNSSYGETEDYEVTVNPFPACVGTPSPGIAIATSTLVCVNTPISFSLSGASFGVNLDYQWQSSPDNSNWTNIGTTQQNYNYTINSLSTATYFRCMVTCTTSSSFGYSSPVFVDVNPPINCYCTINVANNNTFDCTSDKIVDFSISNVVGQTTNCDGFGYSDSTASNYTSVNLTAGNTYTLMVNTSLSGSNGDGIVGAWIDYDQNSLFDANEFVTLGYGPSGTYSTTLTLPITVNTGIARMRIMLDAYYAGAGTVLSPCTNNSGALGQVLDYKVNFTAAPACSGAPNAGTAVSTSTGVCAVDSYTLDLTGNDLVSNISYQWQSSPDGSVWTNLGPAQITIPYAVATQSATTWYRCITTCTSSSMSGTSTAVTVNQNAATACYCTPENTNCGAGQIMNVLFETLNDSPVCDPSGYNDNTGTVASVSLTANQSYTMSVDVNSQSGTGYVGYWIDFDQNGMFDANEYNNVGSASIGTLTTTVNVPFTALGGDTRMRLKMESTWGLFNGLDPCMAMESDGQTLDYLIHITPSAPCGGTPNAGDATSTTTITCQNSPFTLDLTGNDIAGNMTYQWQSSPDNTNWTNMGSLQSFVPYSVSSQSSAMYYRCITTCTSTALSATSTPIAVSQNPFLSCYCTPGPVDCSTGDEINNMVFATISNTSTCNGNMSGYDDYTASVATATINALQTYTMEVTLGNDYNENVSVWIDYDHSGSFDASEYTFLGSSVGSGTYTVTGPIDIPANAMLGTTRMRVRNFSNNVLSADDACAVPAGGGSRMSNSRSALGSAFGETEDYMVTILPPDCSTITFPPSMNITGNTKVCQGQSTVLDLAPQPQLATGITYQWYSSTTGTFTPDGGPGSTSGFTASPAATTYYYCDVMCNGSVALTSNTATVEVDIISTSPSFTNTSCNGGCNGAIALNASSSIGGILTYSWTPNVGSAGMVVALCAGNYSAVITSSIGCTDTQTFTITEPSAITASVAVTNVSCFGLSNGSATITAAGGTGSYTYSWTPGGIGPDNISGLAPGTYSYMVWDANNCNISNTFTVTEPAILAATGSQSNVSCFGGNDGMATITPTGGTGAYTYTWTPGGSNSQTVNNLSAGTYICDIADANNCMTSNTLIVTGPSTPLTATSTQTNVTCFGGNDGVASVTPSGGTVGSGYTYFWSGGFGAAGNTISGNVTAGTYTCTITDANNCTYDEVITLTQATQIGLNISGANSLCEFSSATYSVGVSNAVGAVTYTWSTLPSAQSSNAATLSYTAPAAGTETVYVEVTDANGCSQLSAGYNVNVGSSTNISGTATVQTTGVPVAGYVTLYKYEPFFTKFDSIDTKTLDVLGNYSFNSAYSGTYIVKVVPSSNALQITYGNSEVNWKTAHQISHGCAGNAVENIAVIPLSTFTTSGTGSLSGTIYEGQGYGQRLSQVAVPGNPIGGIIVKGGKNPGGQMFVQTTTGTNGTYTLSGLPPNTAGEEYFILVDIPGLDTNNTYHKVITISNNNYTNLDFVVDSAKINPVSNVSVHDITAIENQIKVFPNPASGSVNIQYSLVANSVVTIELYDVFGKAVRTIQPQTEQSIRNHYYNVGLDGLASGMYFVKLKINNAESVIKLFVAD
jgi:hypothetical protein